MVAIFSIWLVLLPCSFPSPLFSPFRFPDPPFLPSSSFSPFSSDYFLVLLPHFIFFSLLISVSPSPTWSPVLKSHLWKSRIVTGSLKCHAWHIISHSFIFNTPILHLWSIALINSIYMHVCTHAPVCEHSIGKIHTANSIARTVLKPYKVSHYPEANPESEWVHVS